MHIDRDHINLRTAAQRQNISMQARSFSQLNPRVWWLRIFSRKQIERERLALMPAPFDLAAILSKARGVEVITTPPVLVRYNTKIDATTQRSLSLNANNPERKAAERMLGKPEVIAGSEAFALYGYGIAEKFAAIDEHVYESMTRLSGDNIQTLGSLSDSLMNWKHDFWDGLSQKGLDKFGGHLGEVYAAKHLEASGISVDWPSVSNQKGYDLIAAGHEVNVKTVADVDSIREHFRNYPDIPAVIPSDSAGIPSGAFHFYPEMTSEQALRIFLSDDGSNKIVVDHGLSHHQVFDQANDATDAALGGASIADLHFPWITAATSSWREWQLLSESKTTMGTAFSHVGLDVVGRGGGAAVGGKAGAFAGSIFGPIGTAIGGVVGAVAGAIIGGSKTDEIKYASLKEAQSQYKTSAAAFRYKARAIESKMRDDFKIHERSEQLALTSIAAISKSELREKLDELIRWRQEDAQFLSPEIAKRILPFPRDELKKSRDTLLKSISRQKSRRETLWPSAHDLAMRDALVATEENLDYLQRLIDEANNGDPLLISEVFSNLARIGVGEKIVSLSADILDSERREREGKVREAINNAYQRLASARADAFVRLRKCAIGLKRSAEEQMRPAVESMTESSEKLRVELRKHGMG